MTVRRCAVAAMAAALNACSPAGQLAQVADDGFENKPWDIQRAQLPPYPREENLIEIYVSPTTTFRFFIDARSLSVKKGGLVRYTLVARSPDGGLNVSYEGIRCETLETKRYAYGRADETWSPAKDAQWISIPRGRVNRQQAALAEDVFCASTAQARGPEEVLGLLKRGSFPNGVR